jgi:GNAT superfamily N-acetyltransferase
MFSGSSIPKSRCAPVRSLRATTVRLAVTPQHAARLWPVNIVRRLYEGLSWRTRWLARTLRVDWESSRHLVYVYPSEKPIVDPGDIRLSLSLLTPDLVRHFFQNDVSRKATFLSFLEQNFIGLLLHDQSDWATYAWICPPRHGASPPHFTLGDHELRSWIFWCRTHAAHQGKGLYTFALKWLVRFARRHWSDVPVYLDTAPTNVPARRSARSAGFEPCGAVLLWRANLAGFQLNSCRWDRSAVHNGLA